jgi:hypothetical protein
MKKSRLAESVAALAAPATVTSLYSDPSSKALSAESLLNMQNRPVLLKDAAKDQMQSAFRTSNC